MPRPTYRSVDEYIDALPEQTRALVQRARATLKRALPKSTEGISYGIPIVKLDDTMVLFFAGYARHWSIYPLTPGLLRDLGTELEPRLRGKTIRFSLDERFPTALVSRIAKVRAREVAEKKTQPPERAARSKR